MQPFTLWTISFFMTFIFVTKHQDDQREVSSLLGIEQKQPEKYRPSIPHYESFEFNSHDQWSAEYKKQAEDIYQAFFRESMPQYAEGYDPYLSFSIIDLEQINKKEELFEETDRRHIQMYYQLYFTNKPQVLRKAKFYSFVKPSCTKQFQVAYIWLGESKIPNPYQAILDQCQQQSILLGIQDFYKYAQLWNEEQKESFKKIDPQSTPIRKKMDMLKLLYLYFESGVYSDFDTQIREECYEKVFSPEIVFTNINRRHSSTILIPEENFMFVRQKRNPQVKRMLEFEIMETEQWADRWAECKSRQCLIVTCQEHFRDNIYKKGYD